MNPILEQFSNKIEALNEDAGRGRGPQVLKGLKDLMKKASTTAGVDYFNRPPKMPEFNLMNYYTLDVRLKEEQIVGKFQANIGIYVEQMNRAINDVAIAGLGVDVNLQRFKDALKLSF